MLDILFHKYSILPDNLMREEELQKVRQINERMMQFFPQIRQINKLKLDLCFPNYHTINQWINELENSSSEFTFY